MTTITHLLRGMHRVSEVERINDGPFLLHLQVVVVEKTQNFLLDLHVVRIEKEESTVVVKIALTEANREFDKVLNLLIPIWNLSWEFRNSWDRQTIWILCNNEVHRRLLLHLAREEEFPRCSNLTKKNSMRIKLDI